MGKGLGGGFVPVAALLASKRVVQTLQMGSGAFSHGQTYQGHPLACRAALEVQRIIQQDDLVANVRKQGALLGRLLKEKLASITAVGDVRGKGLFWGIEFVMNKRTKEPFDPTLGVAMGIHELGMYTNEVDSATALDADDVEQGCKDHTTSASTQEPAPQMVAAETTSSLRQHTTSRQMKFDTLSIQLQR